MIEFSTTAVDPASTPWLVVLDTTALILVLIGALLCVTAAIGLVRFRDVPSRLHAATKPQVLGVILICVAIALSARTWAALAFLVPIVLIQLAMAPLAAQMIGRQAYRNRTLDLSLLRRDELASSPMESSRPETDADPG